MYADNMTIIVPGKSRTEVIKTTNKELKMVSSWLTKHKLIVNPTKTKYIKPHEVHKNPKLSLEILTQPICKEIEFKFLGILTFNNLFLKSHMQQLLNKLHACLASA